MSPLGIVFLSAAAIIAVVFFTLYLIKINKEAEEKDLPGPDEIEIVDDVEYHVPAPGDFYIRDSRNDFNPFEMYYVFRIEEIRKNVYGDLWVKYTAPGFDTNYTPKWKELECPLHAFLNGKVRVIKKSKIKK